MNMRLILTKRSGLYLLVHDCFRELLGVAAADALEMDQSAAESIGPRFSKLSALIAALGRCARLRTGGGGQSKLSCAPRRSIGKADILIPLAIAHSPPHHDLRGLRGLTPPSLISNILMLRLPSWCRCSLALVSGCERAVCA
jgi:hypothetical protein